MKTPTLLLLIIAGLLLTTLPGAAASGADSRPPVDRKQTLQQAPPAVPPAGIPPGGFVEVAGDQLVIQGQPITIKGVNYYPRGRPWAEMWQRWDSVQMERELRMGRDLLGINAIRVLLPYHLARDRYGHGKVTPELVIKLRELAQIAGALDMRLMVALFDFYDGFPAPGTPGEERNFQYLRQLLGNFAGDDRIFAWDLHNEPDHYNTWLNGDAPRVLTWLGRMADEARRIAPGHLITVGMGQYYNLWQPGPDGRRVVDYSDVVSIHIYNAADAARQLDELRRYTDKPILLQEFGWPSGPACGIREYNEAQQTAVYEQMLAAARERTVGVMAWTLRDYHSGPTKRWDTREEHYGLFRPDDTLKPAALLFRDYAAAPLPSLTETQLELRSIEPYRPDDNDDPIHVPGTPFHIKGLFRLAYDLFGGVGSFGLPLTEAFVRPHDGRVVQYFEAAILERHNERAAQYPEFPLYPTRERVRLTLLPANLGQAYTTGREFPQPERVPNHGRHFPETGYSVQGQFYDFYKAIEGEWRLGPPISEETIETVNGAPQRVQYFVNGQLLWNAEAGRMEVGRLGQWAFDVQCH